MHALIPLALALLQAPSGLSVANEGPLWLGDWNGDGLADALIAAPGQPARLLENRGGGDFADVSGLVGLAPLVGVQQVLFDDLDGDGRTDLLAVHGSRVSALCEDDGVLVERTAALGLASLVGVQSIQPVRAGGSGGVDLLVNGTGGQSLWLAGADAPYVPVVMGQQAVAGYAGAPLGSWRDVGLGPVDEGAPGEPSAQGGPVHAPGAPGAPGASSGPGSSWSATPGGYTTTPGFTPLRPGIGSNFFSFCVPKLLDKRTGNCLVARSFSPKLGDLYPTSNDFNVDVNGDGRVGLGTAVPTHRLTVKGSDNDVLRLMGTGSLGEGAKLNFGEGEFAKIEEFADDELAVSAAAYLGLQSITGRVEVLGGDVIVGTTAGTRFTGGEVDVTTGQYPALRSTRTTSDVDSAYTAGLFKAETTGNMLDGFGSFFAFVAEDNSGTENTLATIGAKRDGADNSGRMVLRTRNNGSNSGVIAMHPDGSVSVGAESTSQSGKLNVTGVSGDALHAESDSVQTIFAHNNDVVTGLGIAGSTDALFGYGVFSYGNFGGTGAKFFIQPHPSDPSKEVRYVCLEGDESGTYFRGSATLVGGSATIAVPESFRLVSSPEGLTVQLTAVGAPANLWVERQNLDTIIVRGNLDCEVNYFVNGVRRGFEGHEPIRTNHAFVPRERGVPYGTRYPQALRQILVENGTLNPDFTPNEATAVQQGWDLRDPAPASGFASMPEEREPPLAAQAPASRVPYK